MKSITFSAVGLLAFAGLGHAQSVTIDIDAGQLRGPLGTTAEPVGGLLQVIASPSGVFSAPTATSYVSGDNVVVMNLAMNNNSGTARTFNPLSSIALMGSSYTITSGEELELRFYPNLTFASMPSTPGALTTYGEVRSSSVEFGTAGGVPGETGWVVPSAGSTVNFEYVTVSDSGTYANNTAYANSVVTTVPEPSAVVPFACGLAGIFGLHVWKRKRERRRHVA